MEARNSEEISLDPEIPKKVPLLWPIFFGLTGFLVLPSLAGFVIVFLVERIDPHLISGIGSARSAKVSDLVAHNIISQVVEYTFMWTGFLLCVLYSVNHYCHNWREDIGWKIDWKKDIPIAVGVVIGTWFAEGLYAIGYQHLTHTDIQNLGNSSAVLHPHSRWRWVFAIIAIFFAPVIEEIFFRGLALYTLAARYGSALGVIGSALLFALVHIQTTLKSTEFTVGLILIVGLVFGLVRVKTGRLGTTVLSHMLFNSVAVLVSLRS